MSATLASVYARISTQPGLLQHLTLAGLIRFIKCAAALRRDILLAQAGRHPVDIAPEYLPRSIEYFLGEVAGLSQEDLRACWQVLREIIWDGNIAAELSTETLHLFRNVGHEIGLTLYTFYPPNTKCIVTTCGNLNRATLTRAEQLTVMLHTLDKGAIQASSVQLYCSACHTCYHHSYYVSNGRRVFYRGVPDVLQVSTHHFIEVRLIELWINSMLFAWTSASNCARLYNSVFAAAAPSHEYPFSPFLRTVEVWDAVVCLCLLQDCQELSTTLDIPHLGEQEVRFNEAMNERNVRLQQGGLPDVRHYCQKCTRFYDRRETGGGIGAVSAVVIDGITIGHPCCSVHACLEPLKSQRDRFCEKHEDRLGICAINGCESPITQDSLVCDDPAHVNIHLSHVQRGQSRFQLQRRLQEARAGVANSLPDDDDEVEIEVGEEEFDVNAQGHVVAEELGPATCPDKPATGNRRIRAQFGRRRTHNDQLAVAPCGVILGRGTFYGAESLPSVVHFIKQLYQNTRSPQHIIYDNNCSLAKHVKNDPFFADIGLSVDVFHFNCKHSAADTFCQENCNPSAFAELKNEDGGWFFNSSVAEQTNAWMGGYHSICREMHVIRYNFFLDEMVMRRNRVTLTKLEENGHQPMYW